MNFLNIWFDAPTKNRRVMRVKGDRESLQRLAALLSNVANPLAKTAASANFQHSPKFGIGPRDYTVEIEVVEP